MQMGRFAQTRQMAERAFYFVSLPPLRHCKIPGFGVPQWSVDVGNASWGYWSSYADPQALGIWVIGSMDCVVAVEKPIGFGDRFLNGTGVYVDAGGVVLCAPPELEFE